MNAGDPFPGTREIIESDIPGIITYLLMSKKNHKERVHLIRQKEL